MKVSNVTPYLVDLEREGFTGSVTLNFHEGNISKKISKKVNEEVKE